VLEEVAPPPRFLYEQLTEGKAGNLLQQLGYAPYLREVLTEPAGWIFSSPLVGMDVVDPGLYEALVAAEVAEAAPGAVKVRSVRYENPFGEEIVAVGGAAEKTLKATPGVIETVATIGSRRKIKKVEAEVAEATAAEQIEDAQLDIDIKREQLRAARIANDIAEQEHLRIKIENARAILELDAIRQRELVAHFIREGKLDGADAVAALPTGDAAALHALAQHRPELSESQEPDPIGDEQ